MTPFLLAIALECVYQLMNAVSGSKYAVFENMLCSIEGLVNRK